MWIIGLIFIMLFVFLNWRDGWHLTFSKLFLALVMAFHLLPLVWLYYDEYIHSSAEFSMLILVAITKVLLCCLSILIGVIASRLIFRQRLECDRGNESGIDTLIWRNINVISGVIIIVNNTAAAKQAISGGYLEIYASPSAFLPIKTITVLPFYVFTLFMFLSDWIQIKKMKIATLRRSVLVVFAVVGLSFLLTGSRSTMMYLLMALLVVFTSKIPIKIGNYLPAAIGVVSLSVLIGFLRDGAAAQFDLTTFVLRPVVELANTSFVFLRCEGIANQFITKGHYLHGLLYIFPVSMLNAVGITPPNLLSQQYVNIIDPGWAAVGGGFGFSIFAEFYLMGGRFGALVFSLATGIFTGWVDTRLKSGGCLKSALLGSIAFTLLFLVRGEIIESYRNLSVFLLLYLFGLWREGRRPFDLLRQRDETTS